ncbi:hypothetical protein GCM10025762_46790 [Haloechinothrix salitolerans]
MAPVFLVASAKHPEALSIAIVAVATLRRDICDARWMLTHSNDGRFWNNPYGSTLAFARI